MAPFVLAPTLTLTLTVAFVDRVIEDGVEMIRIFSLAETIERRKVLEQC